MRSEGASPLTLNRSKYIIQQYTYLSIHRTVMSRGARNMKNTEQEETANGERGARKTLGKGGRGPGSAPWALRGLRVTPPPKRRVSPAEGELIYPTPHVFKGEGPKEGPFSTRALGTAEEVEGRALTQGHLSRLSTRPAQVSRAARPTGCPPRRWRGWARASSTPLTVAHSADAQVRQIKRTQTSASGIARLRGPRSQTGSPPRKRRGRARPLTPLTVAHSAGARGSNEERERAEQEAFHTGSPPRRRRGRARPLPPLTVAHSAGARGATKKARWPHRKHQ